MSASRPSKTGPGVLSENSRSMNIASPIRLQRPFEASRVPMRAKSRLSSASLNESVLSIDLSPLVMGVSVSAAKR